jgi:dolichol kinase
MTVRAVVALAVAAIMSVLGALILGEYDFEGFTSIVGGLVAGLVVSEVVLEIGRTRCTVIGVVTGLLVAGGLGWAAWISSGEGSRVFPAIAWLSMAVGGAAAAARTVGWWSDPL